MAKSKARPSISKLRKVDLSRPRNDYAIDCEGCGDVICHDYLCPDCMAILNSDDAATDTTE